MFISKVGLKAVGKVFGTGKYIGTNKNGLHAFMDVNKGVQETNITTELYNNFINILRKKPVKHVHVNVSKNYGSSFIRTSYPQTSSEKLIARQGSSVTFIDNDAFFTGVRVTPFGRSVSKSGYYKFTPIRGKAVNISPQEMTTTAKKAIKDIEATCNGNLSVAVNDLNKADRLALAQKKGYMQETSFLNDNREVLAIIDNMDEKGDVLAEEVLKGCKRIPGFRSPKQVENYSRAVTELNDIQRTCNEIKWGGRIDELIGADYLRAKYGSPAGMQSRIRELNNNLHGFPQFTIGKDGKHYYRAKDVIAYINNCLG